MYLSTYVAQIKDSIISFWEKNLVINSSNKINRFEMKFHNILSSLKILLHASYTVFRAFIQNFGRVLSRDVYKSAINNNFEILLQFFLMTV